MNVTVDSFITEMGVHLGKSYTDEQREFIKDITKPAFVFASPGTGKTQSAVGALLTAELFHKIPGDTIYALSFTNKATSELEVRHKLACEALGIKQRVQFMTLHKLCSQILADNFSLLDMYDYSVGDAMTQEEMHEFLLKNAEEKRISLQEGKVKDLIRGVNILNSTLTFDPDHVANSPEFERTGLSYNDFTQLRKSMYDFNKYIGKVPISTIQIYTLELLLRHPEVSDMLKKRTRIMLVDEAQDLSLLQLGLVNSFTDCPVLIGDQKQQIYGFQGACPEIKREYFRMNPDARELTLSKSFRCLNNIADYATPLILKNNVGGTEFTGCGDGGVVEQVYGMNVEKICSHIKEDYINNKRQFPHDILFLYRNNYSAMPLIEELYKQEVPFRSYKYPGAMNIPFVHELCKIVDFVRSPTTPGLDNCLRTLIPEFRGTTGPTPLMRVAKQLGSHPFEVNYAFKNEYLGARTMEALISAEEQLRQGKALSNIFNTLWPILYEAWGKEKERYTDKPAKYYIGLAAPVIRGKIYDEFINKEYDKAKKLEEYEKLRIGVRCYTMHAAKGLEADIVHIIDADKGVVPNDNILDRTIKKGFYLDAAKAVRNERSLVYVACTRARKELYIHYNSELSTLFLPDDHSYDKLDMIYETGAELYNDIDAFEKFTKKGGVV